MLIPYYEGLLPEDETAHHLMYREEAKPWLLNGRMIASQPVDCGTVSFTATRPMEHKVTLPALLTTAWENGNGRVQMIVNPAPTAQTCQINGRQRTVPALDGILIPL